MALFVPAVLVLVVMLMLGMLVPVRASSISFILHSRQSQCFYAYVENAPRKIGFFYAVQEGPARFTVNYQVKGPPGDNMVMREDAKDIVDYAFAAQTPGEYSFCFSADSGAPGERWIDVDITVEGEHLSRPTSPVLTLSHLAQVSNGTDAASDIDKTHHNLRHMIAASEHMKSLINSYEHGQRYQRMREHRSNYTVRTTENRLWWFSTSISCAVVLISCLQVFVVRRLVDGASAASLIPSSLQFGIIGRGSVSHGGSGGGYSALQMRPASYQPGVANIQNTNYGMQSPIQQQQQQHQQHQQQHNYGPLVSRSATANTAGAYASLPANQF